MISIAHIASHLLTPGSRVADLNGRNGMSFVYCCLAVSHARLVVHTIDHAHDAHDACDSARSPETLRDWEHGQTDVTIPSPAGLSRHRFGGIFETSQLPKHRDRVGALETLLRGVGSIRLKLNFVRSCMYCRRAGQRGQAEVVRHTRLSHCGCIVGWRLQQQSTSTTC